MRAFIDTNVLLDYLNCRAPFFDDAAMIVGLCVDRSIEGIVSSLTLVNCMYIARKMYARADLFAQLDWMLDVFTVSPIDRQVIKDASALHSADFEDAVQYHSALRCGADCIISRDEAGFKPFPMLRLTPSEFIARCRG